MTTTMERIRAWQGTALFSYGFRPFFLFGALYAALLIALWLPWYLGAIALPSAFAPVTWHVHELLFGYVLAIEAGFLLTAVPNWTGRLPVVGWPLVGLFSLWLVGRLAVAASLHLAPAMLALLTFLFPVTLVALILREVLAAGNTKNLIVVAAFTTSIVSQARYQFEFWYQADNVIGDRLGIAATLVLIMIIGGRITPSFTRNWIKKENPGREPVPFGRFDAACLLLGVLALLAWVSAPYLPAQSLGIVGMALLLAAGLHAVRCARWAPDRTLREPLVAVLHAAYAFVPLGFALAGLALLSPRDVPDVAAMHAWTVGAIALMTLAVMTRASRGHTSRPLTAPIGTVLIYGSITLAALTRVAAALWPDYAISQLYLSGFFWCAAFLGFVALYGPMLWAPRGPR